MTDERLDTWYVWLDSHIRPEVYGLHLHRHVWLETQAMLRANPDLPESYWWEFMGDTYAVTQAVALRRQVDTRRDVISLARLLMQMQRGARVLSRGYFLSRYGTDTNMIALGEETWADTFAGDAGEHLDPAIPNADLDTLVTAAAAVKDFVDDHLAHRSLDAQPVADDSDARRSAQRHRRRRPDVPQILRTDDWSDDASGDPGDPGGLASRLSPAVDEALAVAQL
jgi:hypothetical protein